MALDPNILLQSRPVNILSAIQGGFQTGEMIRNSGLRDAILGNQVAQGQQNLAIGNQSQQLNEQTLAANEVAAQGQQRNLALQQTKVVHDVLMQIKTLPLADRAGALAQAAQKAPEIGLDPQKVMQQGISDAELDQTIAATAGFLGEQQQLARGQKGTAFFTKEDGKNFVNTPVFDPNTNSIKIDKQPVGELSSKLGQTPEEKSDLDIQTTGGKAKAEAEVELDTVGDISEARKFGELKGSARGKAIDKGVETIQKIDANVLNLDKALDQLKGGASTGVIESKWFPSFRAATVNLEQIQGELALDVIGAVTFGALSQGELDLAKQVALPTGLQPKELIKYLEDKKSAQGKLRDYYNNQIKFLAQGGSVAGFLQEQERVAKQQNNEPKPSNNWPIMEDANGNRARVGPNGEIEEI